MQVLLENGTTGAMGTAPSPYRVDWGKLCPLKAGAPAASANTWASQESSARSTEGVKDTRHLKQKELNYWCCPVAPAFLCSWLFGSVVHPVVEGWHGLSLQVKKDRPVV